MSIGVRTPHDGLLAGERSLEAMTTLGGPSVSPHAAATACAAAALLSLAAGRLCGSGAQV